MKNQINMEKVHSTLDHCCADTNGRHFWEFMGVYYSDYFIWKCSQCHECKLTYIRFVKGDKIEY